MIKELLSNIRERMEVRSFWRVRRKSGSALLKAAKKVIHDYVIQEKQNNRRLDDMAKTGIYAYHFNYADQAMKRLEDIPATQQVLGNELRDIQVSYDFVQQMAPDLTEWEKLHHFQYGTVIHDLSGEPVETVETALTSLYLTAWMGLTHQKFKEQAKPIECITSAPIFVEQIGPGIIYRKGLIATPNYYFFNPNRNIARTYASRERE